MRKLKTAPFLLVFLAAAVLAAAPKVSPEGVGLGPVPGKAGNLYGWGGAAGTRFRLDPEREVLTLFATQLYPGGGKRKAALRDEFLKMVSQALTD